MFTPKTFSLIRERMPNDLSTIVIKYFQAENRNQRSIVRAGEYETCLDIPWCDFATCVYEVCRHGHVELAKYMISRGVDLNWMGFYSACRGGHKELIEYLISCGSCSWNLGLGGACRGGHMELAKDMMSRGVDCLTFGLTESCMGGHKELARLMVHSGAIMCNYCNKPPADHLL